MQQFLWYQWDMMRQALYVVYARPASKVAGVARGAVGRGRRSAPDATCPRFAGRGLRASRISRSDSSTHCAFTSLATTAATKRGPTLSCHSASGATWPRSPSTFTCPARAPCLVRSGTGGLPIHAGRRRATHLVVGPREAIGVGGWAQMCTCTSKWSGWTTTLETTGRASRALHVTVLLLPSRVKKEITIPMNNASSAVVALSRVHFSCVGASHRARSRARGIQWADM